MASLATLLEGFPCRVVGSPHVEVTAVVADSRVVRPGSLFVAVQGTRTHGGIHVAEAVARGACAVLGPQGVHVPEGVVHVVVEDTSAALHHVASSFWGWPQRTLRLVGVTGTDGKTSVAFLTASLLSCCGAAAGYLGTLGARLGARLLPTGHTTPPPPDLYQYLDTLREWGATAVALEASSHGLHQGRLDGLRFDVAVFTTFGRDHLDYHGTPEAYLAAKLRLLDLLKPSGLAVVNVRWPQVIAEARRRGIPTLTFGFGPEAQVRATRVETRVDGTTFHLQWGGEDTPLRSPLLGAFQVENLLAAMAACVGMGLTPRQVSDAAMRVPHIPGRFQPVSYRGEVWALVDYAHTPQALEHALRSARDLTRGKLIVVFGCGGDRDRGKRPLMGSVASRLADVVIVTSDNPRSEDPLRIIEEILTGVDGRAQVVVRPDRAEALQEAAGLVGRGDLVVVAGKGHETTQTVGTKVLPFSDAQVLADLVPGWARGAPKTHG